MTIVRLHFLKEGFYNAFNNCITSWIVSLVPVVSCIRHKDFFRPAPSCSVLFRPLSVTLRGPPPGFCNGLDWRALVELRPPTIGKLRR